MKRLSLFAVLLLAVSASGQEPTNTINMTATTERPLEKRVAALESYTLAHHKEYMADLKDQLEMATRIVALEREVAELKAKVQPIHAALSPRYGDIDPGGSMHLEPPNPLCPKPHEQHQHEDGTCHDDKTDALVKP